MLWWQVNVVLKTEGKIGIVESSMCEGAFEESEGFFNVLV